MSRLGNPAKPFDLIALVNEMSIDDLIDVLEKNDLIAKACVHLALNMIIVDSERRQLSQVKNTFNGRFEIIVTGEQVSSGAWKHLLMTPAGTSIKHRSRKG